MSGAKARDVYGYVQENAERTAQEICSLIHSTPLGKGGIVMVTGPTCSGKSLVALALGKLFNGSLQNSRKVAFAQPDADRSDVSRGKIVSRLGELPAYTFATKADIERLFHKYDVVVIDEVQFTPFEVQSYLEHTIEVFAKQGGWFVGLGLLYNAQGGKFLLNAVLEAEAQARFHLYATCQVCGGRAEKASQRLTGGKVANISEPELLPPSAKVTYEPRCEECWMIEK